MTQWHCTDYVVAYDEVIKRTDRTIWVFWDMTVLLDQWLLTF